MTISKAYALLETEGVLERRPGLPSVVRKQKTSAERATKREQLEQTLRPAALKARQMKIESGEALEVFKRLLEKED
jgi:GntR family transcriptional regulator